MKIYQVDQGSPEWFKLRTGIPTASEFHKIVTPKQGKLSASSLGYAYELAAERLLHRPSETVEGQMWMDRGKELEPQAVAQYEFVNEIKTARVGFVTTDDGLIGASPDRFAGPNTLLEVKCPSPAVQLRYLLEGHDDKYRPQVQGQLLVTEYDWAHFYAFHPRMPACTIRTARDEAYIALLAIALDQFNDLLVGVVERAAGLGVFQAYEDAATPSDVEEADALRDTLLRESDFPGESVY